MSSIIQALKNPWRQMLAADTVILIGLYLYKIFFSDPQLQYLHLLVDYHFGFAKRAFVGTVVSLFVAKVPVWFVYVLGPAVILVALLLFLLLFKRTFGFRDETVPLLVFVAGSPFFFKNFLQNIGFQDVYGCIFAIVVLLIPARTFLYVVIAGLGCIVLVMIHHLHIVLYVPTIGAIVVMRYYFMRGITPLNLIGGALLATAAGMLAIKAQFYGSVPIPMDQLIPYLQTKTADPNYFLNPHLVEIWYRPLDDDMSRTRNVFLDNLPRIPVFLLLIAVHWPVLRYFAALVGALAVDWQKKLVIAGIGLVTVGNLIIFRIAFDYSRWVSAWAVCMFLIMFAVKMLPARAAVPLIAADDKWNKVLGWIVTVIPRVGTTKPF